MARRGGIVDLSQLVRRVYPKREPEAVATIRAFGWWCKAVSPRVLENARPIRLHSGVLTVHTSTSAWANSLQLESTNLLASISNKVANHRIKRLAFRVGPLPEVPAPLRPKPPPAPIIPLSELPDDVARELARVQDDDLREAIGRAVAMGLAKRPE